LASEQGAKAEIFLPSRFYNHPTVDYLSHPYEESLHPLDPSALPKPQDYPKGKDFLFILDEFKMGDLEYLQQVFPQGDTLSGKDPLGATLFYVYRVRASELEKVKPEFLKTQRGLVGTYRLAGPPTGKPLLERLDPVVNFTFRDLPSADTPLSIHWKGKFLVFQAGEYQFLIVTFDSDQADLSIDGRALVNPPQPHPTVTLQLKAGWHTLEMDFQKGAEEISTVNLLWKKPGDERFDFVPNSTWTK
jgi:hypothetical protein